MSNVFEQNHTVPYDGVGTGHTLSFVRLIGLMQETVIAHSNASPLHYSWYENEKKGFLLTNWQVEAYAYPKLYDRLRVATWPCLFRGLTAQRSFAVYGACGACLAKANTRWAFLDLAARKLLKIPPEVALGYGRTHPPSLETDFSFPETAGFEKVSRAEFAVLRSDLDSNFHVNNVKYIEWAFNYLPEDLFFSESLRVTRMKTRYGKEMKLNERAVLETYRRENEIISLIRAETDEGASAGVYTRWGLV